MAIALPFDSIPLEPEERVSIAGGFLKAGALGTFRLAGAGVSLLPSVQRLSLDLLRQHVSAIGLACGRTHSLAEARTCQPSGLEGRIRTRLAGALAELAAALVAEAPRDASIRQAARSLSGLGPGLTPSGDDILVGLLAEATVLVQTGLLPQERLTLLQSAVSDAPGTTPVAMAMRRHALAGEFPEALTRFVEGLGSPAVSTSRLRDLAECLHSVGAQSGSDLMAGAVAVARATALKGQPQ